MRWGCHRASPVRPATTSLGTGRLPAELRTATAASALVVLGLAIAAAGIYVGETDDAPGAALIGILLMIGAVALAMRVARRRA